MAFKPHIPHSVAPHPSPIEHQQNVLDKRIISMGARLKRTEDTCWHGSIQRQNKKSIDCSIIHIITVIYGLSLFKQHVTGFLDLSLPYNTIRVNTKKLKQSIKKIKTNNTEKTRTRLESIVRLINSKKRNYKYTHLPVRKTRISPDASLV